VRLLPVLTSEKIDILQQHITYRLSHAVNDDLDRQKIFLNYSTLRLRKSGRDYMVKVYDSWKFSPPEKITARILLDLFNKMEHPYYLDKRMVVLFSEQDAFMCKMAGFENWLEGK
jgi:hypothetical protein